MKREKDIKLHRRFITSYKKNAAAVFFSFALTFMLLSCMLTLLHTNHRVSNIQLKCEFSPEDCYASNLSAQQLSLLKRDSDIEKLALSQDREVYTDYECNKQRLNLIKCDAAYTTLISTVLEGSIPKAAGEVAAEKWVLLNLGIEPAVGKEFVITNADTGEKKRLKVTAILSDMFGNKKYGIIFVYTPLDNPSERNDEIKYVAHMQFKQGVSYEKKVRELQTSLGIGRRQIRECPARETAKDLYTADIQIICVILLVCMVVFYGVYRIASVTRMKQYGILRAIGMKRRQLQKMILMELYQIYLAGIPAGIGSGILLAYFIMKLSGDRDKAVYLYGEKVQFELLVPGWILFFCVVFTGLLVGIVGYMAARKAVKASAVQTIAGNVQRDKVSFKASRLFRIKHRGGKESTLFSMAGKYIVKDIKTSGFVALTICVGITLFTGLSYKVQLVETYRNDTKEMAYLNGQYAMNMLNFDNIRQGISRKSAEKLQNLPGISQIKTASGLPIRILDEDGVKRNEAYYADHNSRLNAIYGYADEGFDGKNQVYKSLLYGYNQNALEALKPYVISGDYDPANLRDDEIILQILRMDVTKENETPGAYREGAPLMDYKAGDTIRMKYRADLNTDSMAYEKMEDSDADYAYKTYKIAAIVCFGYMYDCKRTIYPLMITRDEQIKNLAPESAFQSVYLDGAGSMSLMEQISLEQKLIRIGSKHEDVSTRSLISEIEQSQMFYRKQMVYVLGIAIVAFVLVMLNMINNLKYRMQARTQEICMLRAVGMSVKMTKKMMLFENAILGAVGTVAAFLLSRPVLQYLYRISDMKAFGHPFHYNYGAFAAVSVCALGLCIVMSFGILKEWKTKQIMEGIGKIE